MVVSSCRSTRLLIADLRRPALRSLTAVILFAALPGICSAGDPPVLPPLEIPVLTEADAIQVDGDLTDWRQVIGPPTLAMIDMWGDVTEGDGMRDLLDYRLDVWIAVLPPDRVLLAFERRDTEVSDQVVDGWRDGQFEFMMEVAPQEVASDAATAQRVEVLPFAEGGLSVRYAGALGAWRNTSEYLHGVTDSDPPKTNHEVATRVEVSLTVFDVVSDVGLQESVRSDLKVGDAITLGVIGVDVDPCDWCVAVVTYPFPPARILREDPSGFAQAVLVGFERPPTVVLPSGWGSLKRLLRW